jgi:L-asparagine transporter-like permease
MLFIYMLIALAQLRLRAQIEAEDPSRLQVKMWLFPYATWATIAGMIAILVLMGLAKGTAIELGASVLVTALFALGYWAKTQLQKSRQSA